MGTHDERWFQLVRHPLAVRRLSVEHIEDVTPRMRRVTLSGPELTGFTTLAPEDHVKLFFPAPGAEEPRVPRVRPDGTLLPFGVEGKPVSRDYTLRHFDPVRNRLAIDFFRHGHGVASAWVERARPGSRLGVAGPRGSYVLNAHFAWQLCVGDETALPEIARRIEETPAGTRIFAVLGVADAGERQSFDTAAEVELEWVERPRDGSGLTRGMLDALGRCSLPIEPGFTWLAGEAGEVRGVYRYLAAQIGFDRSRVHASGHWKRGVVDHDHHEAIEA
jgi:NADPH-dependent ferric siderophore reductase